jgi:hypothetical protein
MGYYDEIDKAKTRIRKNWLPKVLSGQKIEIDLILADIEEAHIRVGEKTVIKYIERISRMELLQLKGGVWSK